MKEACLGTTKRVRMMLESQCPDCNGTGAKKGSGSTVRKSSITTARKLTVFLFRNVITVGEAEWRHQFKVPL